MVKTSLIIQDRALKGISCCLLLNYANGWPIYQLCDKILTFSVILSVNVLNSYVNRRIRRSISGLEFESI